MIQNSKYERIININYVQLFEMALHMYLQKYENILLTDLILFF